VSTGAPLKIQSRSDVVAAPYEAEVLARNSTETSEKGNSMFMAIITSFGYVKKSNFLPSKRSK